MSHVPTQAAFTSMDGGPYIVRTPVWCTVVRGFTVFFAFIIMVLAGLLMHGYVMTPNAFALVCVSFSSAWWSQDPSPPSKGTTRLTQIRPPRAFSQLSS